MRMIRNLFDVSKLGTMVGALLLGVGLASCETEKPCNPSNEIEGGDATKGIEVFLEMEDENGITRTVSGDNGYSFTTLNGGGVVQADGIRFYPKGKSNDINVNLTFHAQENVVFQGWSWRYAEDAKGTHLDQKGNKISDYISTPALQAEDGLRELSISKEDSGFTCTYDPTKENKVYVKVKYCNVSDLKEEYATLHLSPIFLTSDGSKYADRIGYVDPYNPDYDNPLYTNEVKDWGGYNSTSERIEGNTVSLSKFGVDLRIVNGYSGLAKLLAAKKKLHTTITMSGSIVPICRFIYNYKDGSARNKVYFFRKMVARRERFSNAMYSFNLDPEHHAGFYEGWNDRGASSPYWVRPISQYDKEWIDLEYSLYKNKGMGRPWTSISKPLHKFDYEWMTEDHGWRITSAKIDPIILDDTIYYFDCRY